MIEKWENIASSMRELDVISMTNPWSVLQCHLSIKQSKIVLVICLPCQWLRLLGV